MSKPSRITAILCGAAVMACAGLTALAQKSTPAEAAAKLTGAWKINRELTPAGRGRGRGAAAIGAPRLVLASFQRGGGGDPSAQDLTPEQLASREAMRLLQQIPVTLQIAATPDSITFTDTRAAATFPTNNKAIKIDVGKAKVEVKTKWDKGALRQEFNAYQQKLTRSWTVDENDRLVLNILVESMTLNTNSGVPTWTQQIALAMFDRQR